MGSDDFRPDFRRVRADAIEEAARRVEGFRMPPSLRPPGDRAVLLIELLTEVAKDLRRIK